MSQQTPITVRPARMDDLATLVDFNCKLAWESEHHTLDPRIVEPGVAALLADPVGRGRYWVATHGESGPVVGQLQITREWSDWRNGWFWWLQSVYVDAQFRRMGVFSSLVAAMKQAARQEGDVIGLRLYVEQENHAAQRTYERLGLQPIPFQLYQQLPIES
ncbi:GNAT family N-acetyltransferase [Tuwongella immobilis]|uniref:N-acetyltransferase domain-containing protein n=1 Tax=Tuwongella immobilis TaxID=692036 RepID=A0A6C2YHB6_9BACT|nr:GNAT family N-acetyltransferase [Tuwongella immobilis]VIP00920.1 gcn5-related n-acetyltransferase-like protein : GCN5-related N-acetyltransferase OS=Glaciecola arctica BSs20135 GN=GARC_3166 PE=4 SV=1: Acetyltransf_1 [Tuwongella immobilis]VTR97258.1 gcn5-related n-acetyltransferase-like protein : GCN5-related N-acetyltransferase OS=Glaciecola arctica BSs20135 GN=GARC_3166 PE=4 SV=1: Acetyltransf_1 [Tuwongella immobilis]